MNIEYHGLFYDDFAHAVDFLNDREPGLGYEFINEVEATIQRIQQHPRAWSKINENTRRIQVSRFRYTIRYQIQDDQNLIYILSLMHTSQHPSFGKNRE